MPYDWFDKLYCKSSENMSEIPDESIHLVVTSPPYNVGMEYEELRPHHEYMQFLESVFREVDNKLVKGGRICINVASIGRKPRVPLHFYVMQEMLEMGYLLRGEIIWDKGESVGTSTAWGSWQSASNPILRDTHEYILVFSKGQYERQKDSMIGGSTISKRDFLNATKSVWKFTTASAKHIGHPAPFPEELPRRLIDLYSYQHDTILDPFCGSGTTCVVAQQMNRLYVGYDTSPEYIQLAEDRLAQTTFF